MDGVCLGRWPGQKVGGEGGGGGGGVERSGACVTQAIARGGDHVTTQCVNVQYQYSVPIHTCNVGYQCSVYVSVRVK